MKIQELLEAREPVKGNWKIQNLNGVMKTFKDPESSEARAWMRNRDMPVDKEAVKRAKEYERQERANAKAERDATKIQVTLDEIYRRVEDAIGMGFPDGDPIDHFGRWLEKNNATMADVDRAYKKYHKKTYYQYLGDMWEGMARDAFHDAWHSYHKHGKVVDNDHSVYWRMDKDGPKLNDNPWLSQAEQAKSRKDMADRY